jgi:putative Ca2+/H+ antiporter (TMEM165/GDT1 family)
VIDPLADSALEQSPDRSATPEILPEDGERGLDAVNTNDSRGFSREFLTAFGTIFLAELGDKTQLSTLLMTAQSQSPWIVFTGAAAALVTTSLFGVIIGRWLARYLSPAMLKTGTGASLLLIAVLLIWDAVHL